jgi:hypothetical protein
MEEMRKKWQATENKCKELEFKLQRSNLEKNTLQRQINELKIDIENHNDKRQQAENERDKLQKQLDIFKDILSGDNKSTNYYAVNTDEQRRLLFSNYNSQQSSADDNQQNVERDCIEKITTNHQIITRNLYQEKNFKKHQINEDHTASLMSDYTEDDIDFDENEEENVDPYGHLNTANIAAATATNTPNNENIPVRRNRHRTVTTTLSTKNLLNTNSDNVLKEPSPIKQRDSTEGRKRRQQRNSTSLTRNDNNNTSNHKRSRTRSNDLNNNNSGITAITTVRMSEDGRPLTVTSEIQHDNMVVHKQSNLNQSSSKLHVEFQNENAKSGVKHLKNRKKRPSREFLHGNFLHNDSASTEDSDIFWDGSEDVANEATNLVTNTNLLTPIHEQPNAKSNRVTNNKQPISNPTPNRNSKRSFLFISKLI